MAGIPNFNKTSLLACFPTKKNLNKLFAKCTIPHKPIALSIGQNNISRLEIDHRRAKELGILLEQMPWVANVEPVETNILIFGLQSFVDEKLFMEKLKQKGIAISSMGHGKLRIVTHLDYKEVMHEYVMEVFSKLQF